MNLRNSVEREGFATVPGQFPADSVASLLAEIAKLNPFRSRAGVRHALQLTPVRLVAHGPALMDLARQVLGWRAFPFRATLFDKSPQSNWLVVWHQDTALPLRGRADSPGWGPWSVKEGVTYAHAPASALSQVLALRLSLDDSTKDNGPLRVLPGTHTFGVLNDDAIHDLARRIESVDCVVPVGGVVAMRPLLVHASSKSQGDMPRRVLHIEYAASETIASPLLLAVA